MPSAAFPKPISASSAKLVVAPGITFWPGLVDARAQRALIDDVFALAGAAPFHRPVMPVSGKPFRVEQTNFGPLGWVSDIRGYRYEPMHPLTGKAWPPIPDSLLTLWAACTGYPESPECCLVNLYRGNARMGLHQDKDEDALDAPVLSVSLGDEALFRIGGDTRKGPTRTLKLRSGDMLAFGGPARMAFHGIDRIVPGSSALIPGGGRLNLTLRKVRKKDARPGG